MGWKTIQGRRYLYRTVRDAGRVRSIYVGRGKEAEECDRQMQERRRALAMQREAIGKTIAEAAEALARSRSVAADIDLLIRASLVAAGYYQHDRGLWRIRRFVYAE